MNELRRHSRRWITPGKPGRAWMLGATAGVAAGAVVILLVAGPNL